MRRLTNQKTPSHFDHSERIMFYQSGCTASLIETFLTGEAIHFTTQLDSSGSICNQDLRLQNSKPNCGYRVFQCVNQNKISLSITRSYHVVGGLVGSDSLASFSQTPFSFCQNSLSMVIFLSPLILPLGHL